MNNELVLGWASALAGRVLNDAGLTLDAQIDRLYRIALFEISENQGASGNSRIPRQPVRNCQ
jgi:hypothetical protein